MRNLLWDVNTVNKNQNVQFISRQLFACASECGNSQHKRALLIDLPKLILELADQIFNMTYKPKPFTVFAVTDPKLREIFAPSFVDRIVHRWLINHIGVHFDKKFIYDSYSNRKGKGTQAAIKRVNYFMKKAHNKWYCKLDIQAFFPSIDCQRLITIWTNELLKISYNETVKKRLDHIAKMILLQNPINPPPIKSGNKILLKSIPKHKSLFHAQNGKGLPIGSLTSQFFANVYLNELDQFIKHSIKIKNYVRYVDDFVIFGEKPEILIKNKKSIELFLENHLELKIHPNKTVIQRCNQGIDYLGAIIYPNHILTRQRSVKALRKRITWFKLIINNQAHYSISTKNTSFSSGWNEWIKNHNCFHTNNIPTLAFLKKIVSTINSYFGIFSHSNTYKLRKHIYEKEFGILQRFFTPNGADYKFFTVKKMWVE